MIRLRYVVLTASGVLKAGVVLTASGVLTAGVVLTASVVLCYQHATLYREQ